MGGAESSGWGKGPVGGAEPCGWSWTLGGAEPCGRGFNIEQLCFDISSLPKVIVSVQ